MDNSIFLPKFFTNYKLNILVHRLSGFTAWDVQVVVLLLVIKTISTARFLIHLPGGFSPDFLLPTRIFDLSPHLDLLQDVISDIQHKYPAAALFIGGDFDARVGEADYIQEKALTGTVLTSLRTSSDRVLNSRGSQIFDFFQTSGFILLNGRTTGDVPAQFTYCSARGKSNRLTIWINETKALPEEQAGFIAKRSCDDNIFTLLATIQLNLCNRKSQLHGLFVDFRRAFDSVPYDLLWKKLFNLGVSPKLIKILRNLYNLAKFQVKSGHHLSNKFDITEGVLQGEILSPTLFILYLHDIVDFFRARRVVGTRIDCSHDLLMLLYADDLIILASSVGDLRKKLVILEDYCRINALTVNIQKTKAMNFRKGGPGEKTKLHLNGELIEWTDHYMYLGLPFTTSSLGLLASKNASQRAKTAVGAAISTLAAIKADSWESMLKIFDSIVASTLLYASHIWGLRYLNHIEITQFSFFKRLLFLPLGTPSADLKLELRIRNVKVQVLKMALSWVCKVLDMPNHRLPKICLLQLIKLAKNRDTNLKYNWVLQLKEVLDAFKAPTTLWDNLSSSFWRRHINSILSSYSDHLTSVDLDKVNSSRSCQIHIPRSLNSDTANYL
ncbi:Similar to jockey\pol: RNA-directed DNA polymerase from mobile element jockey (Drosophila funebris) [Cotesia congregata]|uniref:Similar to jockey\pol: RNA-directed DNA polymerase from mobile element jockey (Drosophila funebris) n=1 Tax=Cotesia congregata TaxID=51543 RepID=A0A8J2HHV0_COTCN|nr:Similar to jockey\pol: RNA-directed DNA polymerase from mobile element jockey (Drosophila funebris) [Cotesia congregata]